MTFFNRLFLCEEIIEDKIEFDVVNDLLVLYQRFLDVINEYVYSTNQYNLFSTCSFEKILEGGSSSSTKVFNPKHTHVETVEIFNENELNKEIFAKKIAHTQEKPLNIGFSSRENSKKNRNDCNKQVTFTESLENYLNNHKIVEKQLFLLDSLRFDVLSTYKTTKNKKVKKLMLKYHAIAHLITLVIRSDLNYFEKISEWINMNFETSDFLTNICRGNFDVLLSEYPYLDKAISDFRKIETLCSSKNNQHSESFLNLIENTDVLSCKNVNSKVMQNIDKFSRINIEGNNSIENNDEKKLTSKENFFHNDHFLCKIAKNIRESPHVRNLENQIGKIRNKIFLCKNDEKKKNNSYYEILTDKWRNKYANTLPKNIKSIFLGTYKNNNFNWADQLCYDLQFVYRSNGEYIRDVNELRKLLLEENLYTYILKEDFEEAFSCTDSFIKLLLLFTMENTKKIKDFDKAFEDIGLEILEHDYELSFKYFNMSSRRQRWFDNLIEILPLNDSLDLLYSSKHINLNLKFGATVVCIKMLEKKDYIKVLQMINEYDIYIQFTTEFIDFCILCYDQVYSKYLSDSNIDKRLLQIVRCLGIIMKNEKFEMISHKDVLVLLKSEHVLRYSVEVFEFIAKNFNNDDIILSSLLQFVIKNKEIWGDCYNHFKNRVCNKIIECNKV
ncbi:hypothetical protein EDEG_02607 [Edhazardia aedis USNM 41457]|uniref:Uncharacterized protein n=1 Tax=Edhazardia aedis (strain USNM 41457) TaxID=1003232 RepID=J9DK90_EDHAE|nr:hypothetical protein EDEG_02607 [Edhazardia aedis USNM 41457]|eukprot:EJW03025.1 hypothetical protein EDEG_02607 [Edhazardia aedis USNM 41457]